MTVAMLRLVRLPLRAYGKTRSFGSRLAAARSAGLVASLDIASKGYLTDCHATVAHVESRKTSGSVRCFTNSSVTLKEYPAHEVYGLPALSPTMDSGTIAEWAKKEGEEFSAGEVLCSIETDKASVDFEAQDDGFLAKILRQGSDAVDLVVGTPICVVVEDASDVPAFADFVAEQSAAAPIAENDVAAAEPPSSAEAPPAVARDVPEMFALMPSARHLSQSKGVDAKVLVGTGKGGRVTKGDVLKALADGTPMPPLKAAAATSSSTEASLAASSQPLASPVAAAVSTKEAPVDIPLEEISTTGAFEDVPNNKMRKIIAQRLTESKRDVPHFYTSVEVELDNILALRKSLAKEHDVKVSVNDLIIRCSALALRDVPEVNATFDPKKGTVTQQDSIDVSVAVATPTGLITPIVPNTDKLGLSEITATIRDLAGRARDGKLQPHEYQGGTFCVSNLGMFGIDEFSAVINPPQAAILAVGGGSRRVVPAPHALDASPEDQPKPSIKTIMTGRLSADRRVVDEATAALFLSSFRHYMCQPELLLL